jgi:hypothetical protein
MWKEKKVTNSIISSQMENIRWKTKFSSHELEGKLCSINFTCFSGKKNEGIGRNAYTNWYMIMGPIPLIPLFDDAYLGLSNDMGK